MKCIFLLKNSYTIGCFLSLLMFLIFGSILQLKGACRGEGFMGISSKDPIMSWVDLTFSPVYTSASTSGTSGCKNWDFPYEKYIEYVINKFIKKTHKQLLIETVKGYGDHLEALSIMACPKSSIKNFTHMLKSNSKQAISILKDSNQKSDFLIHLKNWIHNYPKLRGECFLS